MAENINPISSGGNPFMFLCMGMDYEYAMIVRKLRQYGIEPTGSKSHDKMKLHEIELREAKKENTVSSKFLTVTKGEQERIQEKKKEKRIENDPKSHPETMKGQRILGEQILLAIKMKKELEEKDNKKREEEEKRNKKL